MEHRTSGSNSTLRRKPRSCTNKDGSIKLSSNGKREIGPSRNGSSGITEFSGSIAALCNFFGIDPASIDLEQSGHDGYHVHGEEASTEATLPGE